MIVQCTYRGQAGGPHPGWGGRQQPGGGAAPPGLHHGHAHQGVLGGGRAETARPRGGLHAHQPRGPHHLPRARPAGRLPYHEPAPLRPGDRGEEGDAGHEVVCQQSGADGHRFV